LMMGPIGGVHKGTNPTMKICRYVAIVLMVLSGLGACQTTQPVPPITTADKFIPLAMNARRLEIIDNWQMPVEPPYIGHRAQTLPSNLLAKWASQVLQPAGGSGELVFDISRASVTQIALPLEVGIKTLLTDQQESKIKAEFDVKIMWLQPVGGSQALVQLQADHSVTIPESASSNDLQNAIQTALMGALASLDRQARAELGQINNIILP
ncbi:MAG: hypothetical protein VW456_09265, partial [Alphaproteobacteria bacterium]